MWKTKMFRFWIVVKHVCCTCCCCLEHTKILSSSQPSLHVVVVGGTSGIGRGIALAYRKHYPDAYVIIIERNQSAVDEILSQLGSNGNFIRADVSLMSEIRITKQINIVDVLVLSQSILRLTDRTSSKFIRKSSKYDIWYNCIRCRESIFPFSCIIP